MTQQPMMQKNPNGGYLNKSNYGEDSWYGRVAITPELLAQVQATGFVLIEVKDVQTTQHGECRRAVAKQYTPKAAPQGQGYAQPVQAAPAAAPSYAAQTGFGQAPAPVAQAAPATNGPVLNDSIPF